MLRINLLPGYVAQRRITKTLSVFLTVGIVATALVLGGYDAALTSQANFWTAKNVAAANAKQTIDGIVGQAATVTAGIGPIANDLGFVTAIKQYNVAYIKVYQSVFQYTSPKIVYNSMALNGNDLVIGGYTPSLADFGRYLLEMYHYPGATAVTVTTQIPAIGGANPDVPQVIAVPSGIPGKLPGVAGPVFNFTMLGGKIVAVNSAGGATGGVQAGRFGAAGGAPMGGMGIPGRFRQPGIAAPTAGVFGGAQRTTAGGFDPRKDGFPFTVDLAMTSVPSPPVPPVGVVTVQVGGGGYGGGNPRFGGGFRGGAGMGMPGGMRPGFGPPPGAMVGPPRGAMVGPPRGAP